MFKLETCDVFLFVNESKGWTQDISRWGIGKYGHAAMYVGFADFGLHTTPFLFESTGRGCALHSLYHHFGELLLLMRPQVDWASKQQLIANAIDLSNDPQAYYDYFTIAESCIPRVLKTKFPWLPIPVKYHRDRLMICSEAVAECFWRAGIEVLPEDIVPLPGDFVESLALDPVCQGRLLVDIEP
jgi:hypothetical protein